VKKLVQIATINHERFEVFRDERGGRARPAVQERNIAEEVADASGLEHQSFAGVVLEPHLDDSPTDDVKGVARIAAIEDAVAGGERHDVQTFGEGGALLIVEEGKKGHVSEHFGVGRHRGAPS
jgi:hypothetical protein